jgi:hypothetical protein
MAEQVETTGSTPMFAIFLLRWAGASAQNFPEGYDRLLRIAYECELTYKICIFNCVLVQHVLALPHPYHSIQAIRWQQR